MLKEDIEQLLKLDYLQAVDYLKNKYGKCKYDYFYNENCSSENAKAQRSNEGLFIHHIDEDKYVNLSSRRIAKTFPYIAQKSDRLVYCNYLEHLLLHIKIFENYIDGRCKQSATTGIFCYIIPNLNSFYFTNKFERPYNDMYGQVIKNSFDEYVLILKYFIKLSKPKLFDNNEKIRKRRFGLIRIDYICKSKSREIYEKLYLALKDEF